MSSLELKLGRQQFDKLFPFHLMLDENQRIISSGSSIQKLYDVAEGEFFFDSFVIKRPSVDNVRQLTLLDLSNQLIIISHVSDTSCVLRGQFEVLEHNNNSLLFVGTSVVRVDGTGY